jgi:hypothetical protein
VYFDSDKIPFRMLACVLHEIVTVTETDLDDFIGGTTKDIGQYELFALLGVDVDSEAGPIELEGAALCLGHSTRAQHEAADSAVGLL